MDVPGLGDPNVPESNSLAVVDVSNAAKPRLEALVRTGLPFGRESLGGSSPSGVAVDGDAIFVSNGHNDSITVVDARTNTIRTTVAIRIPGLESLRGVLPIGLSYYAPEHWLLVAEAGINAIGIVDTRQMRFLGHVPAGWFPTRTAVFGTTVYAVNAKGRGTGPNHLPQGAGRLFPGHAAARLDFGLRGSASGGSGAAHGRGPSQQRLRAGARGGARAACGHPARGPDRQGESHVRRSVRRYPERVQRRGGGHARAGAVRPERHGGAGSPAGFRNCRLCTGARVTPNHHELAARYAFSDNFYADSEVSVDGHHWLAGSYPNAWTESSLMAAYGGEKEFRLATSAPGRLLFAGSNSSVHPEEQLEAGAIWHHFERHGISFRNYGEGFELAGVEEGPGEKPTGARYMTNVPMPDPLYRNTSREYPQFNTNIPDQYRVSQFIAEVERKYVAGRRAVPAVRVHSPAARPWGADAAARTAILTQRLTWPTTIMRWGGSWSTCRTSRGGGRWRFS